MNATEQHIDRMHRKDLRRLRAESLTAAVLGALRDVLPDGAERDAYYKLFDLFCEKGVEVVTDHDRQQAGLQARGPDGWTPDELRALEAARLELMLRPIAMRLPPL